MTKEQLIEEGITTLQSYGFENVQRNNILTDMLYSLMFKNFLESNKHLMSDTLDITNTLINDIDNNIYLRRNNKTVC